MINLFNKIKGVIKRKYNDKINIDLIKKSNLFSSKYYRFENPEVKMDPAKHYYYYGYKEGKSPSYEFSNEAYLKMYKDVRNVGINPLVHYLKYGKKEKRKIVKDNGYSISDVYYKKFNFFYNYNFYYVNIKNNRVNYFIDDYVEFDYKIIDNIIKYCINNGYNLRIIYRNFDISNLKDILSSYKLDVEFIYLNNNYYIFIGSDEYIICNGYKTAFALINSNLYDRKIFLYLNKYQDNEENDVFLMQLYNNSNVIFLTNNKNLIDKINIYELCFKCSESFESNKIYYHNNGNLVLGLHLLNYIFLNGIYDSKKYSIHAVNNDIKYHLDTNVITYNIKNNESYNYKYIFYLTDTIDGKIKVSAEMEKTDSKIDFILVDNNNLFDENNAKKENTKAADIFHNFEKVMKEAKGENKNV